MPHVSAGPTGGAALVRATANQMSKSAIAGGGEGGGPGGPRGRNGIRKTKRGENDKRQNSESLVVCVRTGPYWLSGSRVYNTSSIVVEGK